MIQFEIIALAFLSASKNGTIRFDSVHIKGDV